MWSASRAHEELSAGALSKGSPVTRLVTSFSLLAPVMTKIPAHRRKGGSVEVVDSKYAVDLATQQSYSENIFLFVPNLIGQYFYPFFLPTCSAVQSGSRLYAHNSRGFGSSLYELPPEILHITLLFVLSLGRGGWASCKGSRADVQVRRSLGHGD